MMLNPLVLVRSALCLLLVMVALLPFSVGVAVAAGDVPPAYALLMKNFEGMTPEDIKPSDVTNLLEISVDGTLLYATTDGRYVLINGDFYDVERRINVTEEKRAVARAEALTNADPETMIVFDVPDGNPDYTITVFTDIDCGYCRKLHREIQSYNDAGIRVQYMSFPRSGPKTPSWAKAETVWCSADRAAALTQAKAGQDLPVIQCDATPIERHYKLGLAAGVTGTPAIMTESGVMIAGYMPADELRARLEQLAAPQTAAVQ